MLGEERLAELLRVLARSWLYVLLPVGLGALGYRIARPAGEPRAGWLALGATFLLAGPVLATKFNVEAAEFGLHVVHRFHLLPILLLAIPVAIVVVLLVAYLATTMIFNPVSIERVLP